MYKGKKVAIKVQRAGLKELFDGVEELGLDRELLAKPKKHHWHASKTGK
jgi:hypothetical protein